MKPIRFTPISLKSTIVGTRPIAEQHGCAVLHDNSNVCQRLWQLLTEKPQLRCDVASASETHVLCRKQPIQSVYVASELQCSPRICAIGEARDDIIATHIGVPARMKLVPIGGSATCFKKKIGKNLMVMPDARPNNTSEVARKYGTDVLLRLLLGLCPCVSFLLAAWQVSEVVMISTTP